MIRLPNFLNRYLSFAKRAYSSRVTIYAATFLLLFSACGLFAASTPAKPASKIESPDVLVLVLSGMGPMDMVSINYSGQVSDKDAQSDLAVLVRSAGWSIKNAAVRTETASVPGAKPATSASFQAQGLIDTTKGTLPLEPFIIALKRFKSIQVNFLVAPSFKFKGLKDFENKIVKIKLNQNTNSYLYNVQVKDSDFSELQLPANQQEAESSKTMSGGVRFILIFGAALLIAVLVYFITARQNQSRKSV